MILKPVHDWKNAFLRTAGYLITLPLMLLVAITVSFKNRMVNNRKRIFHTPLPVIVIGSVLTGGTGKTPLTQYLALEYYRRGYRPAVVTSGYRKLSKGNQIVSDGKMILSDVYAAGDEAMMMAQSFIRLSAEIPVVSGKNRVEAIRQIETRFECNRILMDDGLQYPDLVPDVSVVTFDASRLNQPVYWLPWGHRRDNLYRMQNADMVMITKKNFLNPQPLFDRNSRLIKLFPETTLDSYFIPDYIIQWNDGQRVSQELLKQKNFYGFSGLADNTSFRRTLDNLLNPLESKLIAFNEYPDHHWYSAGDFENLFERYSDDVYWITTEKDAVKIKKEWIPAQMAERLLILVCRVYLSSPDEWIEAIEKCIMEKKKRVS